MPEERTKRKSQEFKWLIRVILLLLLVLILHTLFGHGVTSEQRERLQRSQQTITKLREKLKNNEHAPSSLSMGSTTSTLTTQSRAQSTSQASIHMLRDAAQVKCDHLFQEIFDTGADILKKKPEERDALATKMLPQARELAALYDAWGRVSEKGKLGYCNNAYMYFADLLASRLMEDAGYRYDPKQAPDEVLKSMVPAMKFLCVIDLPMMQNPVVDNLQRILDPWREQGQNQKPQFAPYPQALNNLDLDLLAPRRAWDWRQQIPYHLANVSAWAEDFTEQMSTLRGTYKNIANKNCEWSIPQNLVYTVAELPFRHQRVDYHLNFLDQITAKAENAWTYQDFISFPDQGLADMAEMMVGSNCAGTARARLACAALEILRGDPIPAQPAPDSYFYNPYTGGRVELSQSPFDNEHVRVTLSVNYKKPNLPDLYDEPMLSIILPVNHPALLNAGFIVKRN